MSLLWQELRSYIGQFVRGWYRRAAAGLDIIGLILILFFANGVLPTVIGWSLVLLGVFWAGFDINRQLSRELAELRREQNEIPEVLIELIDDHPYSYALVLGHSSLPNAALTFHLRITNNSDIDLRILAITASVNAGASLWDIRPGAAFDKEGRAIMFPTALRSGRMHRCNLTNNMEPKNTYNDAQFAYQLNSIDYGPHGAAEVAFHVEVMGPSGKTFHYDSPHTFFTRTLKDFYIGHWQEEYDPATNNYAELVQLAGGE
jgi:hypothetical protein